MYNNNDGRIHIFLEGRFFQYFFPLLSNFNRRELRGKRQGPFYKTEYICIPLDLYHSSNRAHCFILYLVETIEYK